MGEAEELTLNKMSDYLFLLKLQNENLKQNKTKANK